MKIIGITGGVGAGKSEILAYISGLSREGCRCYVIRADEAAHRVERPGGLCYEALLGLLGRQTLSADGTFDRRKMADAVFGNPELLQRVNAVVHPAVKAYILGEIEEKRREGLTDSFFIEAALLIEDGYEQIVDELWYIHADTQIRRKRLKEARGYSDEKIDQILATQLTEEEFRKHCPVVIENGASLEETCRQIDKILGV